MTSGEGGMVITDDEELADRVRRFNSLGYAALSASQGKITKDTIQDPKYERHAWIGWNYRMPELCAAIALGQLERLPELVAQRIKIAGMYAGCCQPMPLVDCAICTEESIHIGHTLSSFQIALIFPGMIFVVNILNLEATAFMQPGN